MKYTLKEIESIVANYNYDEKTEALILFTAKETNRTQDEVATRKNVEVGLIVFGAGDLLTKGLTETLKDNPSVLEVFKEAVASVILAKTVDPKKMEELQETKELLARLKNVLDSYKTNKD